VLKPGGHVGISDLTRTAETIPELEGLLAWIACIGDALPAERYQPILADAGLRIQATENRDQVLAEMVQQVQSRLLVAEIMSGLKKIDLPGVDFSTAKQFARVALNATRQGKLGYGVFTSIKPFDAAAIDAGGSA
jgi:arsenite methyltransferase